MLHLFSYVVRGDPMIPKAKMYQQLTTPSPMVAIAAIVILSTCWLAWLSHKPKFPVNSPCLTRNRWPIIGSLAFFTRRWEFYQHGYDQSSSGHFSFHAGQHPIIALSGKDEKLRKFFFNSKEFSAAEAYAVLLAGVPTVKSNPIVDHENSKTDLTKKDAILRSRITSLMKPDKLSAASSWMVSDVTEALMELVDNTESCTDPFVCLYKIVFQLTVRMVGCNEIASSPALLEQTLLWFEEIENATKNPVMIMFPSFPVWGKIRRMYAGARLYGIFNKIIIARRKENRKENDTLQTLLEQGGSTLDVVEFVLGALFAGQNNSGLQVAWILVHLACNSEWQQRVRAEVNAVADKYVPDTSGTLFERLTNLPHTAWIEDFDMIYLCLKESIRLGMPGTMFRRSGGRDIAIPDASGEIVPKNTYLAMHVYDAHLNPKIWTEPTKWDPSRFLPDRAEDMRQAYTWLGWGHGRHPCLGVKFAKLEINMIIAFWCAAFPHFELVNERREVLSEPPPFQRNEHGTHRPRSRTLLRYQTIPRK